MLQVGVRNTINAMLCTLYGNTITNPGGKFPFLMSAPSWAHIPAPTSTKPFTALGTVGVLPLRGVVLTKHLPRGDR